MARVVKPAERAARRAAILDAAEQLVLSKGYEHFTVQDILDDLHISKGAFYHYFDSKLAVIEALTDRMVEQSAQMLVPIVEQADRPAVVKVQRFFTEIIRWKSAQQSLVVALLPVWYAADNAAFRRRVDAAVATRLAPLLTVIIREGVEDNSFTTAYPDQVGGVVMAIVQALQDAVAAQLLTAARARVARTHVHDVIATYGAHIEAIERLLGMPAGALFRPEHKTVQNWVGALRRSGVDTAGKRG